MKGTIRRDKICFIIPSNIFYGQVCFVIVCTVESTVSKVQTRRECLLFMYVGICSPWRI